MNNLNKKLKVVHLVGGKKSSGAFKGAVLLNNDLQENGIDSKIISDDNSGLFSFIQRKFRQNFEKFPKIFFPNRKNTSFSSAINGINFFNDQRYISADIVNLHWINDGFFNISSLKFINKPIVWTLRDMWAFTGGCHYTLGCENFKNFCQKCPQLKSKYNYDLSTYNQNRKSKFFKKRNINFVVNSSWMRNMALQSSLLKNEKIHTFFPSFDLKNFYFEHDHLFKSRLKLDNKKKIILYGAQNIESKYKGFEYFLKSLDYLNKEKYFIIFFGHFWNEEIIKKKGFEYLKLGFLNNGNDLRKVYSIADVFVVSSIQEGFPKTVAESLLCKTPIVYFKNTSVEDICESKKLGGYGADYLDGKDLAQGIDWIVDNPNESKTLAENASKKIISKFNSKDLTEKYINLYNQILE